MNRKTIALILSILMMISLAACGPKSDDGAAEKPAASPSASPSAAPSAAPIASPSTAPGAAPSEEPEQTDYRDDYYALLEGICELVEKQDDTAELQEGELGIYEAALAMGGEAINKMGFLMTDLNNDDVVELLVGVFDKDVSAYTKNEIYAAYTHDGEKPVLLFEGRNRNAYSLLDGGTFFYYGSSGAVYTMFGEYALSAEGELVCKDYYFTYEKDADFTEIGFYHNTDGAWDPKVSEELDVSEDEFWAYEDTFAQNTAEIRHTRLCDLGVE